MKSFYKNYRREGSQSFPEEIGSNLYQIKCKHKTSRSDEWWLRKKGVHCLFWDFFFFLNIYIFILQEIVVITPN